MSIEEVATRLHLKPGIVQALEQGQYQHLPSAAYARGYLRSYARLMKLDTEDFTYKEQLEDDGILIRPFSGLGARKTFSDTWVFKIAGYVVAGALGLWMVAWWQARWNNDGMDKTISLENLTTEGSPTIDIDLGKASTEKIAADQEMKVSEKAKTSTADKISSHEMVARQQQSPLEHIKPLKRQIELQPTKEAWIEVADGTQKSLYYGLAKPGRVISISGEQPFKLVVGNASEVSVRYDGKRIEITQLMQKGVARFTLDDKGAYR